ncbi:hypothetical protein SDC9_158422 [bioreactor metagenome]|uniref:Uncharacterized protein n=1 Tax=bioreactor metagenome TaxID=1076179 RepID=A0A645F9Z3_9ZZZZ
MRGESVEDKGQRQGEDPQERRQAEGCPGGRELSSRLRGLHTSVHREAGDGIRRFRDKDELGEVHRSSSGAGQGLRALEETHDEYAGSVYSMGQQADRGHRGLPDGHQSEQGPEEIQEV